MQNSNVLNKKTEKSYYKISLFIIMFIMCVICSFITVEAGSRCSYSTCGCAKKGGSCTGVCWIESRSSYCAGHNFSGDVIDSSTSKTEASRTLASKTYSNWSSRNKIDNSSSKRTRIRTETYTVTYNTTTTTKYRNTCSICGHVFDSTETSYGTATETDVQQYTETQYSIRGYVNVYLQDTKGNFHRNDAESEASAGSWSRWRNKISSCSVSYKWSRNIDNTHYASSTHTSGSKVDTSIDTTAKSNNREWHRYIYRKRYWLRLHPNKQSDASTNIVNQSLSEYSVPSGQIYQHRASYVGETFFVPKTYRTFQMYGYASYNTWYTQATGGTARGEGTDMKLVNVLSGYGDPSSDKWYIVDLYARWYSEPGGIYLMPNSSSIGTDSCYGAYIDDGHDDSTEQADTYLLEKRESDVGLGNTSRP